MGLFWGSQGVAAGGAMEPLTRGLLDLGGSGPCCGAAAQSRCSRTTCWPPLPQSLRDPDERGEKARWGAAPGRC